MPVRDAYPTLLWMKSSPLERFRGEDSGHTNDGPLDAEGKLSLGYAS